MLNLTPPLHYIQIRIKDENLTEICKDMKNCVSCSYEKNTTLTFSISNSFFFLDGSSTHKIIWRTLEHGRFFSPIVILTKLCRSWFAKCSMPTGIVADTSMVWWSWEMSSKMSNTCCWKPIFNMVSTYVKSIRFVPDFFINSRILNLNQQKNHNMYVIIQIQEYFQSEEKLRKLKTNVSHWSSSIILTGI